MVRLTDAAGGSTLYFHDNAFSRDGDTLMFNTPNGIAVVEVAKIGKPDLVQQSVARGRGGYFARRTREIYFNAGGRGDASVSAVNVDTKQTRTVPHARGLINADESLSVVKNGSAADPDGSTRNLLFAWQCLNSSACSPGRRWRISHPISGTR